MTPTQQPGDPWKDFRDEVRDKLSVVQHGRSSKLERDIVFQQCENFLIEQAEELVRKLGAQTDASLEEKVEKLKANVDLLNAELGRHVEAASMFQCGGKYHEVAGLRLGQSTVVGGLKWLGAERDRLLTDLTAARHEAEALQQERDALKYATDQHMTSKEPCGHWSAHSHTGAGGHCIPCLDCQYADARLHLAALTREHAQLRAALQKIAQIDVPWPEKHDFYGSYAVVTARAALTPPAAAPQKCANCKGSGNEPEAGFADSPCQDCGGRGIAPQEDR